MMKNCNILKKNIIKNKLYGLVDLIITEEDYYKY
jgi:hypothetical protein